MDRAVTTASTAVGPAPGRLLRRPGGRYLAIWPATSLLFAISPLIAGGSLRISSLQSTLPFAAVLAIVAVGQTLVIQQRGLDLAVPGMVSLSAVVVTRVPGGDPGRLPVAVLVAVGVCLAAGLVTGTAVTVLRITPLIASLGVNALLLGTVLKITGGSATTTATSNLASFASHRILGLSAIVWLALLIVIAVAWLGRATVIGRRFTMIGTSPAAARAAGYPVARYELLTYAAAGTLYGLAGVLLAGYLHTPGLSAGDSYLLPSIAAVVLGGTSLAGGSGSVIGTLGGALFLTQLQQDVFGAGAPASIQLVIQAAVIGAGMAIRTIPWRQWLGDHGRLHPAEPIAGGQK